MGKQLLGITDRGFSAVIVVLATAILGYVVMAVPATAGTITRSTAIGRYTALATLIRQPAVLRVRVARLKRSAPILHVVPPNNYGFSAGELVWMDAAQQAQRLDAMKATGAAWVRVDMEWYVVQPSSSSSYHWTVYDRAINAIEQHGLKALVILDYAPAWAAADGCSPNPYHECSPANPNAFATYAAAAATRYAPRGVTSWEIWNEPNTSRFWYPAADPAGYAELLKVTYLAIKRISPSATVVTGGLGSSASFGTISPPNYIADLYADGAESSFDAIGAHPYSYPALPSETASGSGWTQMLKIHTIAVANGDADKKIWMTEVGASTGGPHPVSENRQAQIALEAIRLRDSYPWAGPLFWYDYQDLGTDPYASQDFFGLVRADGSHKPAYSVVAQAIKP